MIISDSTSLIILNNVKRLDLLEVFGKVYIPKKVYEEINIKNDFILPDFIEIKKIKRDELYFYLTKILDEGESEAIVLAKDMSLGLIIDEKKGRKIAKNLNIKILGFLGVLFLNYKNNIISRKEIIKIIDSAKKMGYRISEKLLEDFFESLNKDY